MQLATPTMDAGVSVSVTLDKIHEEASSLRMCTGFIA
jgi:AMMECR1 domain-containing protein